MYTDDATGKLLCETVTKNNKNIVLLAHKIRYNQWITFPRHLITIIYTFTF